MKNDHLKLDNQLCFPVYAASRLIIREYQPYLNKLKITYPQYLVLLVLWETDCISVGEISDKLILNTNTLTPLLKRMEINGIISRKRSVKDERMVVLRLTKKGKELKKMASDIPYKLVNGLQKSELTLQDLSSLSDNLNKLIRYLNDKTE